MQQRGQVSRVQKVMSGKEVNRLYVKQPFKMILFPFTMPPKSRSRKCDYGVSAQCSLQELRLCLFSINHLMVTGGGPLGATASLKRQPKHKGVQPHPIAETAAETEVTFILQHLHDQRPSLQAQKTETRGEGVYMCV